MFNPLISEDYFFSVDIEMYLSVLDHVTSKVDFSVATGIYMLPSSLILNTGMTAGYNNKNFGKQNRHESWLKLQCKQGQGLP